MCGLSRMQLEELVVGVRGELAARGVDCRTLVSVGLYRSVAMVVALMRQNLTQHTAADIFGVSQATVSRRWNLLRDPIGDAVAGHVPDLGGYRSTVLVDGTLIPTWDWTHRKDLFWHWIVALRTHRGAQAPDRLEPDSWKRGHRAPQ